MRFTSLLQIKTSALLFFTQSITAKPCPHCSHNYTVKRHGSLYGVDLYKPEALRRGIRFYCSNRYSNRGCGRTFSIHFNTVIPYQSVNAELLSSFFRKLLESRSVHQAWHDSSVPFSLRCAYRWVKKFTLNLPSLRHKLHRLLKSLPLTENSIELETISILSDLFPSPNFLAAAQLELQVPILHSSVSPS